MHFFQKILITFMMLTIGSNPIFGQSSLTLSGEPSISVPFGSLNTLNALAIQSTGTGSTATENAAIFTIIDSAGNDNPTTYYKMGISALCQIISGGGSCWGSNVVCSMAAGTYTNTPGCIALEIDSNNAGPARSGTIGNPYFTALYISGTGNTMDAGAILGGAVTGLWRYGFLIESAGSIQNITTASFDDQGRAPTSYLDEGTHVNGVVLGGSYSNYAIGFPNGFIDGNGNINTNTGILGASVNATVELRVPFGAPASSSAACNPGDVLIDATYIYTCIATNSWHRVSNGMSW